MRDAAPRPLVFLCFDTICKQAQEHGWPTFHYVPEMLLQQMLHYLLRLERFDEARNFVANCSLSELDLSGEDGSYAIPMDDHWLEAIQENSEMNVLKLPDCSHASEEGIAGLSELHEMVDLHMGCCQKLTSGALEAMVRGMSELYTLCINVSQSTEKLMLAPTCVQAISQLQHLTTLKLTNMLGLSGNQGVSKKLSAVAGLSTLDVSDTDFDDCTLHGLTGLMNLTELSVKGCAQITDQARGALKQLPKLEVLNLARTAVSDATVACLEAHGRLENLNLSGTKVTNACCEVLDNIRSLTDIDLSCKKITSDGLKRLRSLSNLRSLNLAFSQVTDEGMQPLRQLPLLSSLSLRWTCITDTALAYLAGEAPAESSAAARQDSPEASPLSRTGSSLQHGNALRRIRSDSTSTSSVHSSLAQTFDASGLALSSQNRPVPRQTRDRRFSRSGDYTRELQRCRPSASGLCGLALTRVGQAGPPVKPQDNEHAEDAALSPSSDAPSTSSQDSPEASPLSRAGSGTSSSFSYATSDLSSCISSLGQSCSSMSSLQAGGPSAKASPRSVNRQFSRSGDYARELQRCRPMVSGSLTLSRTHGSGSQDLHTTLAKPIESSCRVDKSLTRSEVQRRAAGLPPTPPKSPPETPELSLSPPRSPPPNQAPLQPASLPQHLASFSEDSSAVVSEVKESSPMPGSLLEKALAAKENRLLDDEDHESPVHDTLGDEVQVAWGPILDDILGPSESFLDSFEMGPSLSFEEEPQFRGLDLDEVHDSVGNFTDDTPLYRSVQDEPTLEEPVYRCFEPTNPQMAPMGVPVSALDSLPLMKKPELMAAKSQVSRLQAEEKGEPQGSSCGHLADLTTRAVQDVEVGRDIKPPAVVEKNSRAGPLHGIEVLDLSVTEVAGWGLHFLGQLPNLKSLNLFSTKVSDEGLQHIAGHRVLVDLNLCGTDITDLGVRHLLGLVSLVTLKVSGNKGITDVGAAQLLELDALLTLEMRSTSVTPDCTRGIQEILASRAMQQDCRDF